MNHPFLENTELPDYQNFDQPTSEVLVMIKTNLEFRQQAIPLVKRNYSADLHADRYVEFDKLSLVD